LNSQQPRIIVFGYSDIGVACLEELLSQHANVMAVVTHEDDPGERIWFGSVAALASARGIPVHAPGDPNDPRFVERMRCLMPDLLFAFYYRRLLSTELLAIPPLGAINLHGSLLPKYRGRAPLNWALIHGEQTTGVTLHYMDTKPDHGDIIAQRPVEIAVEDTALTLSRKLTAAARTLLAESYPLIVAGRAPRIPQEHAVATTFGRRTPADGIIDWSRSAWQIYNLIRAVTRPFPGAFTFHCSRRIFLWEARPPGSRRSAAMPGTILGIGTCGELEVATGDGVLSIVRIQPEDELEVQGADFFATISHGLPHRFSSPRDQAA
jgi:methionyl-tRNA formyltransferase